MARRLCTGGECRHLEMIRLLIQSGAGRHIRQANGWAPIHSAAVGDRVEAIRELLRQGADIDARSRDGNAAIHIAAKFGSYTTVSFLVSFRRQYRLAERRWQHSSGSRGRVWTDAGRRDSNCCGRGPSDQE